MKATEPNTAPQSHNALGQHDALPEAATARYNGPDAAGQAVLRATAFGTVGWFLGRAVGAIGSKPELLENGQPNPKYHHFKTRNLGAMSAFVGAVMGVYGGLKDVRYYRKQVDELQEIIKTQHEETRELRNAVSIERLAPPPSAQKATPHTTIEAGEVERAAAEKAEEVGAEPVR